MTELLKRRPAWKKWSSEKTFEKIRSKRLPGLNFWFLIYKPSTILGEVTKHIYSLFD